MSALWLALQTGAGRGCESFVDRQQIIMHVPTKTLVRKNCTNTSNTAPLISNTSLQSKPRTELKECKYLGFDFLGNFTDNGDKFCYII